MKTLFESLKKWLNPPKNSEKKLILKCSAEYFAPKTDEDIGKWLVAQKVFSIGRSFQIKQMKIWKSERVNDSLVVGINCSYEILGPPYKEYFSGGFGSGSALIKAQGGFAAVYEVCSLNKFIAVYEHGLASISDYESISWGYGKKRWNDPCGPLSETLFNDFKIKEKLVEVLFGRHLIENDLDDTSKRKDTRYVVHTQYPLGFVWEKEVTIYR